MTADTTQKPIIFFDGVCGLCNRFVVWVLQNDKDVKFFLAPLQGTTAAARSLGAAGQPFESILLVDEKGVHQKSKAVLKIMVRLGGFPKLAGIFFIVPAFIRDWVYTFIAQNRYKWFGKSDHCRIPRPSEAKHFLP